MGKQTKIDLQISPPRLMDLGHIYREIRSKIKVYGKTNTMEELISQAGKEALTLTDEVYLAKPPSETETIH